MMNIITIVLNLSSWDVIDQYLRISEKLSDSIHLYETILEKRLSLIRNNEVPTFTRQRYTSVAETSNKESLSTHYDALSEISTTTSSPKYSYFRELSPAPQAPTISSDTHSDTPSETSDAPPPSQPSLEQQHPLSYANYPPYSNIYTPDHPSMPYYIGSEEQVASMQRTNYPLPAYPYVFPGYVPYPGYQPYPYFGYGAVSSFQQQQQQQFQPLQNENLSYPPHTIKPDLTTRSMDTTNLEVKKPSPLSSSSSSSTDQPPLIEL
jgi:hypothetical protein